MSYPSCIKMPVSKSDHGSENDSIMSYDSENNAGMYNELLSIANQVFGHGKWSHAVTSQTVDFVEYVMGKYHIGCAAFVKVQLPDGTYHEEMGYSNAESSVKGSAVCAARVYSITNALKKALLCFGGIIEEKIAEISSRPSKRKITRLNSTESDRSKNDNSKSSKSSLSTSSLINPASIKQEPNTTVEDKPNQTKVTGESSLPESNVEKEVKGKSVVNLKSTSSSSLLPTTRSTSKLNNSESGQLRQMTDEEMRLERKRKQREKQEEYRRLMKQKEAMSEAQNKP